MEKSGYVEAYKQEAANFVQALRSGIGKPAPQVPTCPEWNVNDLILHIGFVHRTWSKLLDERMQTPPDFQAADKSYLNIPTAYMAWSGDKKAPEGAAVPADLVNWFEEGTKLLEVSLANIEPEIAVWTFATAQNAWHWHRMMPLETGMHRWDVQNTYGEAAPLEAEFAKASIDFLFEVLLPILRGGFRQGARPGEGEVYHFHRTDGDGEWLVTFGKEATTVSYEHRKGDIALRGTASDILLFLFGRQNADNLEVLGDQSLVARFRELTPAI